MARVRSALKMKMRVQAGEGRALESPGGLMRASSSLNGARHRPKSSLGISAAVGSGVSDEFPQSGHPGES
jgi:hypothetical protein